MGLKLVIGRGESKDSASCVQFYFAKKANKGSEVNRLKVNTNDYSLMVITIEI